MPLRSYERINEALNSIELPRDLMLTARNSAREIEAIDHTLEAAITLAQSHLTTLENTGMRTDRFGAEVSHGYDSMEIDLWSSMLTRAEQYRQHEQYHRSKHLLKAVLHSLKLDIRRMLEENEDNHPFASADVAADIQAQTRMDLSIEDAV